MNTAVLLGFVFFEEILVDLLLLGALSTLPYLGELVQDNK